MDRVCCYCRAIQGHSAEGEGVTHGICHGCHALGMDLLDEMAAVIHAVKAAGGRLPRNAWTVAAPSVVLTPAGLAAVLELNVDLELPLVTAALRMSAASQTYALEVARAQAEAPRPGRRRTLRIGVLSS